MIDVAPVLRFALLLVRPGVLLAFAPAFGGTVAPAQVKIGLTVFIALVLVPVAALPAVSQTLPLAVIVAREAAIGFALALAIRALVAGAEFAGHLAGAQMGLSYGATIDPQSGVRNPLLAVLYGNVALVTFLAVGGHHVFLRALQQSYVDVPMGLGHVGASLPEAMAAMLGMVFVVGVRLAAPVVVVLLLVEFAMALLARSAPSLNLMAVGAPVRLIVGLILLPITITAVTVLVPAIARSMAPLALRAAAAFR